MVTRQARLPDERALIDDLKTLRRRGITKLAELELPALRQVVRAAGRVGLDEPIGAYVIEAMLRGCSAWRPGLVQIVRASFAEQALASSA